MVWSHCSKLSPRPRKCSILMTWISSSILFQTNPVASSASIISHIIRRGWFSGWKVLPHHRVLCLKWRVCTRKLILVTLLIPILFWLLSVIQAYAVEGQYWYDSAINTSLDLSGLLQAPPSVVSRHCMSKPKCPWGAPRPDLSWYRRWVTAVTSCNKTGITSQTV